MSAFLIYPKKTVSVSSSSATISGLDKVLMRRPPPKSFILSGRSSPAKSLGIEIKQSLCIMLLRKLHQSIWICCDTLEERRNIFPHQFLCITNERKEANFFSLASRFLFLSFHQQRKDPAKSSSLKQEDEGAAGSKLATTYLVADTAKVGVCLAHSSSKVRKAGTVGFIIKPKQQKTRAIVPIPL